ncbi:MAG: acyl-CoA dehydrogenase [Alteromonadaceae bacterium]|jgi:acyl-CoA dehydrogenase
MKFNNAYRVDLRDQFFLLWEQFKVQDHLLNPELYPEFDQPFINQLLTHSRDFAYQKLGLLYQSSDRDGCQLTPEGKVILPSGFNELWNDFIEAQWGRLGAPEEDGGLGAPYVISQMINEILMGANPAFMIYSGFCSPAMYLIKTFGSEQLQSQFNQHLARNEWGACLCMTEPDAGSDIGNLRTKAVKQDDDSYLLEGEKIFISAGMHDLTSNLAYIVLARVEGAKPGTVGLTCFVVPRFKIDAQGNTLPDDVKDNGVRCVRLEEKMGLHGCATAQISFGIDAPCTGYLLGTRENIGLRQLMTMMNLARIATGIYALGMASSAYLNAAEYAAQRIQGTNFKEAFNPKAKRVPIIQHIDVKRMLLEMKSKVEGCRALIIKLCFHQSLLTDLQIKHDDNRISSDEHKTQSNRHQSLVNLLTPIVKAYTSDQAWKVAELAIQVYGGHGYISDHPVEQYARDIKVLSIWEGTNFVQSADLFKDKLAMGRHSKLLVIYQQEVDTFLACIADFPDFDAQKTRLKEALDCLSETHALLGSWIREQKMELIFAVSTRFLEMMAEVTLGWLLLDSAVIAKRALLELEDESDKAFYEGKITSAMFFMNNILPGVFGKAQIIELSDDSSAIANADMFLARSSVYE